MLDAELLMCHAMGVSRARLLAGLREPLTEDDVAAFDALVGRRAAGEPLAYITGRAGFFGLELGVDHRVLIPRPETELLASWALDRIRARGGRPVVLDVGTGSGAVALALAAHAPAAEVHATDVSPGAVAVAQDNARRLGLARRVSFHLADLLPPGPNRYDVLVANLPYVGEGDPDLAPDVHRHEPPEALFAGPDGLAAIRRLLATLPRCMAAGGDAGLEIGWRQGRAAARLAREAVPAGSVRVRPDLAGHDRLLTIEDVR
jgi:release factor glutamine methyltransferase